MEQRKDLEPVGKTTREEKAALGRAEKAEYLARKAFMLQYERRNYSKIVFFRSTKGFFVAGGHSAVILFNLIAPELGMKMALKKDQDFGERFREGVISIKNLEHYKIRLMESKNIKKFEETDDKISFVLEKKLSKAEYDLIAGSEEIKREQLVNMVSSTTVMPKLYQMLRDVLRVTNNKIERNSNKIAREMILLRLLEYARAAMKNLLLGCRNEQDLNKSLGEIEKNLRAMLVELIIIEAAGVWHITECRAISMVVNKALTQITVEKKVKKY